MITENLCIPALLCLGLFSAGKSLSHLLINSSHHQLNSHHSSVFMKLEQG